MPAPNEPLKAPYPNLIVAGFPRIAAYLVTIDFTTTVPSLIAARSSGAIVITDAGVGRAGIAFPAGGTGATGFFLIGPVEASTPSGIVCSIDSDLTNFVTGACELNFFIDDANTVADDSTGVVSMLICVVLGPQGAI